MSADARYFRMKEREREMAHKMDPFGEWSEKHQGTTRQTLSGATTTRREKRARLRAALIEIGISTHPDDWKGEAGYFSQRIFDILK